MKGTTLLVLTLFGSLFTWGWIAPSTVEWAALALMICAGIPHGAYDLRVAEAKWRHAPFSRRAILVTYLMSVLGMAALCVLTPLIGLSIFVIISVVHFAEGEIHATTPPSFLVGTALGISSILVPIGLHPLQSQIYMSYFLPRELFAEMEKPLMLVSHITSYLMGLYLLVSLRRGSSGDSTETFQRLICLCAWALLPPLSGFAVWFIGRHSRQHLEACQAIFSGGRFNVPLDFMVISLLAILGLLPFSLRFDFTRLEELFAASICLIAGLTLPHIIVSHRLREVEVPHPAQHR